MNQEVNPNASSFSKPVHPSTTLEDLYTMFSLAHLGRTVKGNTFANTFFQFQEVLHKLVSRLSADKTKNPKPALDTLVRAAARTARCDGKVTKPEYLQAEGKAPVFQIEFEYPTRRVAFLLCPDPLRLQELQSACSMSVADEPTAYYAMPKLEPIDLSITAPNNDLSSILLDPSVPNPWRLIMLYPDVEKHEHFASYVELDNYVKSRVWIIDETRLAVAAFGMTQMLKSHSQWHRSVRGVDPMPFKVLSDDGYKWAYSYNLLTEYLMKENPSGPLPNIHKRTLKGWEIMHNEKVTATPLSGVRFG